MEKTYRYLGHFMLLLIPLIFAGFYKTYIEQIPNFGERINLFIHIHAAIASVWISMLIAQPFLILNKKFALHRTIGKISYFVFPLLILSFIPQILRNINEGHLKSAFFPIADSLLLISFYSLAIYNRKTSSRHMRFMIATALVFLGPTVGRIGPIWFGWSEILTQNIQYGIIYLILLSLIFYDKSNQRKYNPYLVAITCFAVHQAVFYLVFL
jgi:hypothetical protein